MKFVPAWVLVFVSVCASAQTSNYESRLIVDDIQCRGNAITSCDYIRDRLYLTLGAFVDEEEIGNAKLRLSSLTRFMSVDIRLERGTEKDRVVVVIEVAEADPITTESAIGTSARLSGLRQAIAGRVTNENLFGTGKILSLEAAGSAWIAGVDSRRYGARLLYADPRLFDSSKYFLLGGISYANNYFDDSNVRARDQQLTAERFGIDLAFGRRIFDFSYITLGYQALPISNFYHRYFQRNGSYKIETAAPHGILFSNYGWNSEDDPYFPTRGSRLNIRDEYDPTEKHHYFSVGYRTTWKSDTNATWALRLGAAPGSEYRTSLDETFQYGVAYARSITARDGFGGIQRGRWYVELGGGPTGIKSTGDNVWEIGVKAGVRLDTKTFGLIDLYVIGSRSTDRGSTL